eukprot:3731307-Pyramimonas_sp.AAC.1
MAGEPSTTEMRQPRSIEWEGAVVHDTRLTTWRVHIQSVSALPKTSRITPEGRDLRIPKTHPSEPLRSRVTAEG